MKLYNKTRQQDLGEVKRAGDFFSRLRGLLGAKPSAQGLWIIPCSSVHMIGMRHSLDLFFLDKNLKVLKIFFQVKPLTPFLSCPRAFSVVEFFSGRWNRSAVEEGDTLERIDNSTQWQHNSGGITHV